MCRRRPNLKFAPFLARGKRSKRLRLDSLQLPASALLANGAPSRTAHAHAHTAPGVLGHPPTASPPILASETLPQASALSAPQGAAAPEQGGLAACMEAAGHEGVAAHLLQPPRPTNRAMRRRPARLASTTVHGAAGCLHLPRARTVAAAAEAAAAQALPSHQGGNAQQGGSSSGGDGSSSGLAQQPVQQASCSQPSAHFELPPPGSCVPGLPQLQLQPEQPGQPQVQSARRLETHAWHAKRMRMVGCTAGGPGAPSKGGDWGEPGLWGHALALHAGGKGKGSRSFLHQLRCGQPLGRAHCHPPRQAHPHLWRASSIEQCCMCTSAGTRACM